MLSEKQVDHILGGLAELHDRGLLDREREAELADRLNRIGPSEASAATPAAPPRQQHKDRQK